jgi:hypothetical protein
MKSNYYELRCAVVEMFYETLVDESYTFGQATARCLVEFRQEALGGKQEGLVVLSSLLSRLARHEPETLADFVAELTALRALSKQKACWKGLSSAEKDRIKEDVRFAVEMAENPPPPDE